MVRLTNNTGSPFDIRSLAGNVIIAPYGQITGEFDPEYLIALKRSKAISVTEIKRRGRPRNGSKRDK